MSQPRDVPPALAFASLLLLGLVLAWPALGWPMAFDDLHLMRSYPASALLGAFHGPWDPERLMTPGYRPLTLLFNHLRYSAFGENVVAQRVFLLVLVAASWAWLSVSLRAWSVPSRTTWLAGALWLTSVYSTFHYVWITDGNHMLQGLGFAAAVAGLGSGLMGRGALGLLASLGGYACALGTREDSLALAPVLLLMGVFLVVRRAASRRRLWAYALALAGLSLAFLLLRRLAVPRAQAPGTDFWAPWASFVRALSPAGTQGFDAASWALVLGWWLVVLALAVAVARLPDRPGAQLMLWLGCGLLSCAPALNVFREDLLFFPVMFTSLALATAIRDLWSRGGSRRALAALAAAGALLGGAGMSRVFAENFHPDSLRTIWWNGRYVYGAYVARAVLPAERRRAVVEQLHRFGIDEVWGHEFRTRKLEKRALAANQRRPGGGGPFYPLLPWSED